MTRHLAAYAACPDLERVGERHSILIPGSCHYGGADPRWFPDASLRATPDGIEIRLEAGRTMRFLARNVERIRVAGTWTLRLDHRCGDLPSQISFSSWRIGRLAPELAKMGYRLREDR